MAARPWSHSVFCDRERATEVRKAIASFFAAARETESTTGSLLCKPEAGAGIAIVELNRHIDISLGGSETVQFLLFRHASGPESKRCTAAKKESATKIHGPAASSSRTCTSIARVTAPSVTINKWG